MRRMIWILIFGIMAFTVPATCNESAAPRQAAPAEIEEAFPEASELPADTLTPSVQPAQSMEKASTPAESTKSAKEPEEKKPGLSEKTKMGVAALKVMGRVGSGLIKNFMENLIRGS